MPSAPAQAETDVARLVRSAQSGDGDAFTQLYQRFARMVHGVVLARIARTEVDDVVQDVFMAAYQRLGELREPAAFGGWLAAIARNRAADHGRRLVPVHPVAEAAIRPHAHDRVEALAILEAIRSLPEAYSETLVLRLVEGMTGAEIAERPGLTPGSVRVNLHRGMNLLRETLA
ncbi:MAG TPA: sigma-70 family RNA polymerase sigma factor [Vicinamibacterales bacterium]|nr:sigma-70 family RNA polymerase sigma factor [Vicinamibacterales bacterium]